MVARVHGIPRHDPLGVLCVLHSEQVERPLYWLPQTVLSERGARERWSYGGKVYLPPNPVLAWSGVSRPDARALAFLHDHRRWSLRDAATWIESAWSAELHREQQYRHREDMSPFVKGAR